MAGTVGAYYTPAHVVDAACASGAFLTDYARWFDALIAVAKAAGMYLEFGNAANHIALDNALRNWKALR